VKQYEIEYNGWHVHVDAGYPKQARHRAWVKFNETYPIDYGDFMRGITGISEVDR